MSWLIILKIRNEKYDGINRNSWLGKTPFLEMRNEVTSKENISEIILKLNIDQRHFHLTMSRKRAHF